VQGFEFDYTGVIFGHDLVSRDGTWVAIKANSQDKTVKTSKELTTLLQHTYRVLMSRGMRGTSVYFMDAETRQYVERHLLAPPQA